MRDRIELDASEAWAVYTQLDHYARLLAELDRLAGAAEVDQLATDLWRKLNEEG